MEADIEREGLARLANIEEDLEEIKERTPTPRRAFTNGLFQGAGALVGGVVAIVLLGWVLSLFGLIPGFAYIVNALQDASAHFSPH
jgi:hypothetical protein